MELHHKLRRDPNWHPSACNICGQLGHQAANCTNGTINWKQIYGDEAFKLKAPLYESDFERLKKSKQVDFSDLEQRAREYAKMRASSMGINYEAMTAKAAEMLKESESIAAQAVKPAPAATAEGVPPATSAATGGVEAPMPEGWSEAKDAQNRVYFWHTKTKKVQWQRPTADTPTT